jgi:hypothetical protein
MKLWYHFELVVSKRGKVMNIGFVSTWFERGAAYVTKQYIDAVKERNNIFVYARGGKEKGIRLSRLLLSRRKKNMRRSCRYIMRCRRSNRQCQEKIRS